MANEPIFQDQTGRWCVSLSKRLFQKAAVFSAAYKFNSRCKVYIEPEGENRVLALFDVSDDQSKGEEIARAFYQEAVDQQHRLDLNSQFGHLRDLIVEHAFSPIDNLKERLNDK